MHKFSAALATAALICLAGAAQAAPFQNGSFEDGPNPGTFITLGAGSTAITGWTVGGNSIDYIGTYWQPAAGNRSVDLNGNGTGSISQTFDVVAGAEYRVQFSLAGNTDGNPDLKTIKVSTEVNSQDFAFNAASTSHSLMGWDVYEFFFTPTTSIATLTFLSTITGPYGAALDDVSVSQTPLPAAFTLFGSVLALFAWFRRRLVGVTA